MRKKDENLEPPGGSMSGHPPPNYRAEHRGYDMASDKRLSCTSTNYKQSTPFWPLGFLLVTLALGILGAIAGGIMLHAGLEAGSDLLLFGSFVAIVSFVSGGLETL